MKLRLIQPVFIFLACALTMGTWCKAITAATTTSYFVDEIVNTSAIIQFFSDGNYSDSPSRFFPTSISSGVFSTAPAGTGWLLTRCIFGSRIAAAIFCWTFATLLTLLFFRRFNLSWPVSIFGAAAVWWNIQSLPYGFGYLQNLGELPGALYLALGIFLIPVNLNVGAFFLGVSVWGAKFIYFPVTVGYLVLALLDRKELYRLKSIRVLIPLFAFALPLLLWTIWIYLRTDLPTLNDWVRSYLGFVKEGNSGLDAAPRSLNLFSRLKDPSLEWVGYSLRDKLWITGLLGSALTLASFNLFSIRSQRSLRTYSLLAISLILFYSGWWFLWHRYMWIRHLLPALYLALSYIVVEITRQSYITRFASSRLIRVAGIVALMMATVLISEKSYRHFLTMARTLQNPNEYGFLCRNNLKSCASKPAME